MPEHKSVNLQFNTLVHRADGANESSTKRLMFQVFFFSYFLIGFGHSKIFIFIFMILQKNIEIN